MNGNQNVNPAADNQQNDGHANNLPIENLGYND